MKGWIDTVSEWCMIVAFGPAIWYAELLKLDPISANHQRVMGVLQLLWLPIAMLCFAAVYLLTEVGRVIMGYDNV